MVKLCIIELVSFRWHADSWLFLAISDSLDNFKYFKYFRYFWILDLKLNICNYNSDISNIRNISCRFSSSSNLVYLVVSDSIQFFGFLISCLSLVYSLFVVYKMKRVECISQLGDLNAWRERGMEVMSMRSLDDTRNIKVWQRGVRAVGGDIRRKDETHHEVDSSAINTTHSWNMSMQI